jgi:hypothetical protein
VTRYLISFDDGAMTFPEEELPDVGEAAHKVVDEAKNAGVWIFVDGLLSQRASIVGTDGTITDGPHPETKTVIGGFSIVDVPSRADALKWAGKFAIAGRCAQEVRELMPDRTPDRRPPRPQRAPLARQAGCGGCCWQRDGDLWPVSRPGAGSRRRSWWPRRCQRG